MFIIGNKQKRQYLLKANGMPNLVPGKEKATQFATIKSAQNALDSLPKRWGMFCLEIIDLDMKEMKIEHKEEKPKVSIHDAVKEFLDDQEVDEIEMRTDRIVERYKDCMDAIDSILREINLINVEAENLGSKLKTSLSDFDKAKEALNHKIEFCNRDQKMNAVTGYKLAKELGEINCGRRRIKDAKYKFDKTKEAFDNNKYNCQQFSTFVEDIKTRVSNQVYFPKLLEEVF